MLATASEWAEEAFEKRTNNISVPDCLLDRCHSLDSLLSIWNRPICSMGCKVNGISKC